MLLSQALTIPCRRIDRRGRFVGPRTRRCAQRADDVLVRAFVSHRSFVTQRRPDSVAYDPPEGTQGGGYRGQAVAPVRMKAAPVPAPDSIRGRLRTGMIAATGACSPRTATTWLPTPDSRKWAAPGSRDDQGASGLTWRHVKKDGGGGGDANKQNPHRRHGSDLAPPPVPLACGRADDRKHCVRRSERDCVDPILRVR